MWNFENPVQIRFGQGAFADLGKIINGRPYCLVTYDEPYFKTLSETLTSQAGRPQSLINDITPNPDFSELVKTCARFAKFASPDMVIVALGGGSVIDTVKVLASSHHGFANVRRFLETGEDEDQLASYPIIAVPTTAGTGSELTCWATVWDKKSQKKYSLARRELYPSHAIIDPELMLGIPKPLTISTGLDALSHALESIWNHNSNPVSANHAVYAASEMMWALPRLANDLNNIELRSKVARACLFAGLAFSNTKTALAHSVSYPITLKYDVPHGLACSFTLPKILHSVIGIEEDCDRNLGRRFGPD
jgi:phosphonate metabolism-associated iron-containing alcohol dehydrogenase